MGKRGDRLLVVIWLLVLLMLIFLVGNTRSSRPLLLDESTNKVYKVMKKKHDSKNGNSGQISSSVQRSFFAFLPKATPIPPSGPSREHNGIGLQSSSQLSP